MARDSEFTALLALESRSNVRNQWAKVLARPTVKRAPIVQAKGFWAKLFNR